MEAHNNYHKMNYLHYQLRNNLHYLNSILNFLDVDTSIENSQIGLLRNASMFPRLRKALQSIGLKPLVTMLSKSVLGDKVRRHNKKKRKPSSSTMNPKTRAQLASYFKPYNDRLAEFLGRDLESWNS